MANQTGTPQEAGAMAAARDYGGILWNVSLRLPYALLLLDSRKSKAVVDSYGAVHRASTQLPRRHNRWLLLLKRQNR